MLFCSLLCCFIAHCALLHAALFDYTLCCFITRCLVLLRAVQFYLPLGCFAMHCFMYAVIITTYVF